MKKILMTLLCGVAAGCCCPLDADRPVATAVSPDGRNEIRLWANPLAYAVSRDGVEIVAKSAIGLTRDGQRLASARKPAVSRRMETGREPSPVYKKAFLDLAGAFTTVDCGDWGVELAARNDGVAYRFTSAKGGTVTVDGEQATITLPGTARCWYTVTPTFGYEEAVPRAGAFAALDFGEAFAYPPFVAEVGGKTVAVTESDVHDYPVLNYEGIHGLEKMKTYRGGYDFMANDVRAFFLRQTAGPMDYTPGAMLNYPVGGYPKPDHADIRRANVFIRPGSEGTRCRQMAMMALYEAPLQMLCDSPTNYERNMESFAFMAKVPVVWADTLGLGGTPDTMVACARLAKDGCWYAAGLTNAEARDFTLETGFLGAGEWKAEIFRDAADADVQPTHYVHETKAVAAGAKLAFRLAKGGGFVVRFTRR